MYSGGETTLYILPLKEKFSKSMLLNMATITTGFTSTTEFPGLRSKGQVFSK